MKIHPVRAYRHKFKPKISLDSLAKSVGRSKATLSRIENWKQLVPQELLSDLSEATGISPRDLRPDLAEKFDAAQYRKMMAAVSE